MRMDTVTPFASIGEALAHHAGRAPDRDALVFPYSGGRLSYGGWRAKSQRIARALLGLGLRKGDRVALLAENRLEWPIVYGAVALAGCVLVPLNTHYVRGELEFSLRQSETSTLFLSKSYRSNAYLEMVTELRGGLPALRHVVLLDGDAPHCIALDTLLDTRCDGGALPAVCDSDLASLQYTSGTTGTPKGALLTHQSMLWVAWGCASRLGIGPEDRWTSIIPLFHCAGCIMNLLGCLQKGACYVGVPSFSAETMFSVIETERCTALSGVPTSFLAMLGHPARGRYTLDSLRTGTCGGASADPELLQRCAEQFPIPGLVQVYGQTESSTLVTCPHVDDPHRLQTAGHVLDGCELRIVDPKTNEVVPAGTLGEVQARGPIVMQGYWRMPEATRAAIDSNRWLHTGDLGRLTESGALQVDGGRLKDLIIRGGENIYPAEVEHVLNKHPCVTEAAVFGLDDEYYGEVVAAALRTHCDVSTEALGVWCRERLARFKIPSHWFRLDEFPMTASGKIRKQRLREQAGAHSLAPLS